MQRVFIGIPLDQARQCQVNELLKPLQNPHRGLRWVAEQNRHLTLAFLGDQPADIINGLVQSMDGTYGQVPAFQTIFSALTRFPNARGNILALVCRDDEKLHRLYQATRGLLVQNGLAPGHERFRPHITVGRIARPGRFKTRIDQSASITLRIDRIMLYQSTLTPAGSVYLALKETDLLQAGSSPV
jgi:2'-5' RNA ligase